MKKLTAISIILAIALTAISTPTFAEEFNLELQIKQAGDRLEDRAEKATGKEKQELLKLAAIYRVAWANHNLYHGYTDRAIALYQYALRLDPNNTVAQLALKELQPE